MLGKIEVGVATSPGPRETNQDRIFYKTGHIGGIGPSGDTGSSIGMPCGLFCVADGMGGLQSGEYAASVVVNTLETWWDGDFRYLEPKGPKVLDAFFSIFKSINDTIRIQVQQEKARCGTTCSLLMIQGKNYYIAHAGDSRIYLIEHKFLTTVQQLTVDHTWAVDQAQIGKLSQHEIANNPKKDALTSCLGGFEQPTIFTKTGTIDRPCTFILCSDGFYQAVGNREIVKFVKRYKDCNDLAEKLIGHALERGTRDNVSVVIARNTEG